MKNTSKEIDLESKPKYVRLGWKHIGVIFVALMVFLVFVSHLQQNTLRDLLSDTMAWYKKNSAEQIGNLTTASLELLLESNTLTKGEDAADRERNLVHALNSILKQPLMNRNVEQMCVIFPYKNKYLAMDLGQNIYSYFFDHKPPDTLVDPMYQYAVARYAGLHSEIMKSGLINSFQEKENIFHVYVPLEPYGEYAGAVYLRIHPDVSVISQQIVTNFNETVLLFSSLIVLGLLAIFYVSTYSLIERDQAWEMLYKEREEHLREHIAQKKEHLFTKRIYHTYHKAEKVMGFINEDVENADEKNIKEIKYRISKYANFISRVIYDMKWYNPPIQTIRNLIFKTDLNEVLKFIVNNIFLRISNPVKTINFEFNLDRNLPKVSVNEFVIWEIIEPLIQNSIDHSNQTCIVINLKTVYYSGEKKSVLTIEDNGSGVRSDLLEKNEYGIKKIFLENISTKEEGKNAGYGCYLAYEIAKRCGWDLDADNREQGGCRFTLLIRH
ncbi:MAG TPA: HAMP domain-containing sensor histidine kinase [Candidatus Acidoferrales bacterium]|nr:HAMP domain-containing sensor histidine kinase [Candidatus Acidoferrales bacterium]